MNCIIIDDESSAINIIKKFVESVPKLNLLGTFENSIEGLQFVHDNPVELIYLDINMPNLNGINCMVLLNNKCKVILTTAYAEYALESYKYDVVDYLLKPISFEIFLKASLKAIGMANPLAQISQPVVEQAIEDYIIVQTENKGKYKKINVDEIIYIEATLNYSTIFTIDGETTILHLSLKELEHKLVHQVFVRIHKSFTVNIDKIKYIQAGLVVMVDENIKIPLGITYKENLFSMLQGKFIN